MQTLNPEALAQIGGGRCNDTTGDFAAPAKSTGWAGRPVPALPFAPMARGFHVPLDSMPVYPLGPRM